MMEKKLIEYIENNKNILEEWLKDGKLSEHGEGRLDAYNEISN